MTRRRRRCRSAGRRSGQDRQHRRAQVERVVVGARRGRPARRRRRRPAATASERPPAAVSRPAAARPEAAARVRGRVRLRRRRRSWRPASADGSGSSDGAPTLSCRQVTNCCSSLLEMSSMTPRPNCAGLPVIARSVLTSTRVASAPSSAKRRGDRGARRCRCRACPCPSPRSRTCRAASSFSRNVPGAGVDQRDRAELDLAGALEVVAVHLRDGGTREAARDGLDVLEGRPGVGQRRRGR